MGEEQKNPAVRATGDAHNPPDTENRNSMSKARTRVVMLSLCMALFLAALDVTIVATALPTIASHLHASVSQYVWVGSSYTLASTSSTPLWAKLGDVMGRKKAIMLANAVFLAVVQGIGGGGLTILVSIIIGDLFSLRERAKHYGFTAIVWAIASGLGPVLGGVFTQSVSWRWCFYINLPFDGLSLALLLFCLRLETPRIPNWEGLHAVDWIGCITIAGGTVCFLYGLESGAGRTYSWNSAFVICLMVAGLALLGFFGMYEWRYAKHPLLRLRTFGGRNKGACLLVAFVHSFVFIAYDYFVPLYFQVVLGASPIFSGLYLFALVLPLSAFSAGTGMFVKRTGRYRRAIWFGIAFMTIGTGLFISLDPYLVWWKIILFQIVAGIGAGPLFQSPLIALQSHLKSADVAAGTSAFTFLRNFATCISVVIGGVVLQRGLGSESPTNLSHPDVSNSEDRTAHSNTYTTSLSHMWMFYTSVCALGVFASLFIPEERLTGPAQNLITGSDNDELSSLPTEEDIEIPRREQ